jgi:hypothetical protein
MCRFFCCLLQLLQVGVFKFVTAGFKAGRNVGSMQEAQNTLQYGLLSIFRQDGAVNIRMSYPVVVIDKQLSLHGMSVRE